MFRCIVGGNVTEVSHYLDLRKDDKLHGTIIDTLIRDVLPTTSYAKLDDIISAILNKTASLKDILAVEKRFEPETRWKTFEEFPWKQGIRGKRRQDYLWWATVWTRINLANALLLYCTQFMSQAKQQAHMLKRKIKLFIDAHVPVIRYLDSLNDPCDVNINVAKLCLLYKGVGPSHFDQDRRLITTTRERIQLRQRPLDVIQERFPEYVWTPLGMVRELENGNEFIDFIDWDPCEEVTLLDPGSHKLYYACLCLLTQISMVATTEEDIDEKVMTSLYFYYLAFTDFFYFIMHESPNQCATDNFLLDIGDTQTNSLWQVYYPYDTRAFTIYDCPDMFHVLSYIPLWGKQLNPEFLAGKFLQKTLPFSGQPRSLIEMVIREIKKNPAFHQSFQQILWCMLSNAYPQKDYTFDMKHLVRCHQLVFTDCDVLCEAIGCKSQIALAKQQNKSKKEISNLKTDITNGSLVILSAFRLYILFMIDSNPHYLDQANECIDINRMRLKTDKMVTIIRESNLLPDDAFARARKKLARSKKNNNKKVHRYKKGSCIGLILFHLSKQLEKEIYEGQKLYEEHLSLLNEMVEQGKTPQQIRDRMICPKTMFTPIFASSTPFKEQLQEAKSEAEFCLDILYQPKGLEWKENVLNYVMRLPEDKRLTPLSVSVLTLPRYGGILPRSVGIVNKLISNYYSDDKCLPKYFEKNIDDLNVPDINVLVWFFNCLGIVEKIHLVPLDVDTVRDIDYAMKYKRFNLYPGQHLNSQVYEVLISICCKKIKTLMGTKQYGHGMVAYNMDRHIYTCTKSRGNKKRKVLGEEILIADGDEEDDEPQRGPAEAGDEPVQSNQDQRKDFQYIPCDGNQPMIRINIRGYALYFDDVRYQHCPRCGSFHEFEWTNYSGSEDGKYRCLECASEEITSELSLQCSICEGPVNINQSESQQLKVTRYLHDPHDEHFDPLNPDHDIFQQLYFCERHYKYAKYVAHKVNKFNLIKYTGKKISYDMQKRTGGAKKYRNKYKNKP
jgi:hypothetical protein